MSVSPARKAAFEILRRVWVEGAYSSVLLAESAARLDPRDRALCHEVTLGTLRRQIYLDAVVSRLSSKPLEKIDPEVLTVLRMGLYQIEFLDRVPDHAVVNDSVELVVRAGKRSARGFVNAILRNAIRSPVALGIKDRIDELSVKHSHPRWLLERWIERFGFESAKELVEFNNASPALDLRFTVRFDRLPEAEKDEIEKYVASVSGPGGLARESRRAAGADARLRELFEAGIIYFQDEASQLVAQCLAARPSDSVLDACAAPGSKTTAIARSLDPNTGKLVACELNEARSQSLKEICLWQGADFVGVVRADALLSLPFPDSSFDKVLVDAPCTGTGTIARNPEIRYRVTAEDIDEFPMKQLAILRNASKAVRSGGLLIYSTCSLEMEENEGVADAFLASTRDFEPVAPDLPAHLLDQDKRATILPQIHGISGFFITAFRRYR